MNMTDIVFAQTGMWFIFMAPVAAIIFYISAQAETGRAPFDLIEAESEIIAGFNIEYSGMKFGLFFAGESLDIDGVTGGFNFQAAWTTGWIAGTSMAGSSGATQK